jgi:hypothetical protein
MRLDRHFETGMKPVVSSNKGVPMPLHAFAFGPMGMAPTDHWAEIYRLAYERTVEALRPTRYDRAMKALSN